MLIACVKTGDKYDDRYVRRLQGAVKRHLPPSSGCTFVCYTDKAVDGVICEQLPAKLPGWWAKLGLLKLKEPLIYFDLDVVITGSLGPLLDWDGFGIIRDYWLPGFNSSVMKLTGNEGHLWNAFHPDMMRTFYMGDQHYISCMMPEAPTFPPEWFPSWKANKCQDAAPEGALAVVFHGEPKPCQIESGWVKEMWI